MLQSLWTAPAPPRPKAAPWWDWAVVAAVIPIAILEGLLRQDLPGRGVVVVLAALALATLGLRRTHPFAAVAISFGPAIIGGICEILGLLELGTLHSTVALLLLPYSLFRWGKGREIILGLALMATTYTLSLFADRIHKNSDALGGAVVLLLSMSLGLVFRANARARSREVEHARVLEREQLARELHDTVAHHVSAILIHAQAARAIGKPDSALTAVEAIEDEAKRTLAELRAIVGALRDDGVSAKRAPQAAVRDIRRLAEQHNIDLELTGEVDALGPMLQAGLYRLAQESITNAIRHAQNATRIVVRISANNNEVRLTVIDDGDPTRGLLPYSGFGLPGMAERAALLGGKFSAGPNPGRGWKVEAVLPREGAP